MQNTSDMSPLTPQAMTPAQAQNELRQLDRDDLQQSLDEITRERMVRERCYPRWVNEGKLSKSDANDRMRRQIFAEKVLSLTLDAFNVGE